MISLFEIIYFYRLIEVRIIYIKFHFKLKNEQLKNGNISRHVSFRQFWKGSIWIKKIWIFVFKYRVYSYWHLKPWQIVKRMRSKQVYIHSKLVRMHMMIRDGCLMVWRTRWNTTFIIYNSFFGSLYLSLHRYLNPGSFSL